MSLIELTQGQFANVDPEDYALLSQWKWFAQWSPKTESFYAARKVTIASHRQITIQMARFLLGLEAGNILRADHINGDTLDNTRQNIRAVTIRQNNQNCEKHRQGKLPGVYFDKRYSTWSAHIKVNGKKKHIGSFLTEQGAYNAYLTFQKQLV